MQAIPPGVLCGLVPSDCPNVERWEQCHEVQKQGTRRNMQNQPQVEMVDTTGMSPEDKEFFKNIPVIKDCIPWDNRKGPKDNGPQFRNAPAVEMVDTTGMSAEDKEFFKNIPVIKDCVPWDNRKEKEQEEKIIYKPFYDVLAETTGLIPKKVPDEPQIQARSMPSAPHKKSGLVCAKNPKDPGNEAAYRQMPDLASIYDPCVCGRISHGKKPRSQAEIEDPVGRRDGLQKDSLVIATRRMKGPKEKGTKPIPVKSSSSRELRAGQLHRGCDCEKRNGLQDQCPRSECHGSPPCLQQPPTCPPSQFSNAKHLVCKQKPKRKRELKFSDMVQ